MTAMSMKPSEAISVKNQYLAALHKDGVDAKAELVLGPNGYVLRVKVSRSDIRRARAWVPDSDLEFEITT